MSFSTNVCFNPSFSVAILVRCALDVGPQKDNLTNANLVTFGEMGRSHA